ncbi:MAG: hypothetical protein ABEL51_10220 [Salinibacter sp.]
MRPSLSTTRDSSVAVVRDPQGLPISVQADEEVPYAADPVRYRLAPGGQDGGTRYSRSLTVDRRVAAVELHPPAPNPARQSVMSVTSSLSVSKGPCGSTTCSGDGCA